MLLNTSLIPTICVAVVSVFLAIHHFVIKKAEAERLRNLQMMVHDKEVHSHKLNTSLKKRDEEYFLNLYRCYCGDMLREKALFCHKCGRRKGT